MKTTASKRVTEGSTAENAQVLLEYAVMLVVAMLLTIAFIAFANAFSDAGHSMLDLVGYDIP